MVNGTPTIAMECGARRASVPPYAILNCPRECYRACLAWDEKWAELEDAERREVTHYEDWNEPS